jgi:hypothetical protein
LKRWLFQLTQKRVQSLHGSFDESVLIDWALKKENFNISDSSKAGHNKAIQISGKAFEAIAFISGVDKHRFEQMFDDMENNQMKNVDSFPKTLIQAYSFLS